MIEEPVKLTIKKPVCRPSESQIEAFQGVATAFVVDAMDGVGALSPTIKPVGDGRDLDCVAAGPALTADNRPGDVLALFAALKFIQKGDIVIGAFSGYQGCAACGDRVAGMMRNSDAAGYVTDGPVRDYQGIVEAGLPMWCTGINPNSPVAQGPGKVGLPVQIGGMQVETGDMIVADRDGVVVVPFELIEEVIGRLDRIKELESVLDKQVEDGLKVSPATLELLDSAQTRYVE